MGQNSEFLALLDKMKITHEKKSQDYTSGDVDENFNRVAEIQSWFENPIDKAFAGFIAVKLARLATLLNKQYDWQGKLLPHTEPYQSGARFNPNNEPIIDSFEDMTVYAALWTANYQRRIK